jgi:hypothetical protein
LARNQNIVSKWTCLPADCVSVNLHYKNPTQRFGLVQSGPHHHLIEN